MSLPVVLLAVLLTATGPTVAHPSTLPQPIAAQPAARSLRTVGTLGLLFGAVEAETAIERRLERLVRDLHAGKTATERARLQQTIVGTLHRAQIALNILAAGLELAGDVKRAGGGTPPELRRVLVTRTKEMLSKRSATPRIGTAQPNDTIATKHLVDRQLAEMRRQITPHLHRAVRTLGDFNAPSLATNLGADLIHRLLLQLLPKRVRLEDLLTAGLKAHVEALFRPANRRQDEPDTNEIAVSVDPAGDSTESGSESSEEEEGPGGLVGLIASLSGGDEGSDVGALIGSLSAVITNLFGPGGLDVPGLLGTGTSLIAGLLGGDDNFGKVLGSYVGVAIEGLSGGGADMNGAFFGNFLGALIAALSSDPEDENLPLKPKLFVENFFTGLEEAKRKTDPDAEQCCQKPAGGSDLFGFLGHVVSSVVGGVTSLVLNASLGSSGGSSQGSADASGASSAGSSGDHPAM
uniref:Uncharacterized protein n=1 Tax=Anopheles farauti TaxID=69004 RepID=A0A182Q8R2_9DIPT